MYGLHPTIVPGGKYSPQMVAPEEGTIRGMHSWTEGWIRVASRMTATKYGKL